MRCKFSDKSGFGFTHHRDTVISGKASKVYLSCVINAHHQTSRDRHNPAYIHQMYSLGQQILLCQGVAVVGEEEDGVKSASGQ